MSAPPADRAGLRFDAFEAIAATAARPDGTLAPAEYFAGQGEWADSRGVLLVAEVTSFDRRADERDRVKKPRAYAESGIPLCLLVDRDNDTVTVHSEPVKGSYRGTRTYDYGERVELPGLDMVLDTEELKDYSR